MDTLDAIFTRRSIRKYTDAPVSEEVIEQVLRAAMAAPSAGNQQPWQFVVVDERALLNAITEVHPYSQMLKQAPVAIVVCGDIRLEKHRGYWVQDCASATQNLLLAAHELGLGAVWLGVTPREERVAGVREVLGLPAEVFPLSIVALGYPAEEKGRAERYNPERVHRNGW